MADSRFERTLAALPPDLKREVEDFAEFLLARRLGGKGATGATHPLAPLAGTWREEALPDRELLPERTPGREIDE